jgi:hypothetical protein
MIMPIELKVEALPGYGSNDAVIAITDKRTAMQNPASRLRPLARICDKVAAMQQIKPEDVRNPDVYALLGISDDGSVVALACRKGAFRSGSAMMVEEWFLVRPPIPSMLARSPSLGLSRLSEAGSFKPIFVKATPDRLAILKGGDKEVEIWKTSSHKPSAPAKHLPDPKQPAPAQPAVEAARKEKGISPRLPIHEPREPDLDPELSDPGMSFPGSGSPDIGIS